MAYELNDFLIDWFKAYHLSMMSEPTRARLEDMRSGDDVEGDDYVTITSENQAEYREYMTKSVGELVYLSPTTDNLKRIQALSGDHSLKVGDGINIVLDTPAKVAEYHSLFPVKDSPKVGEKIYLNDFRSGAQKTWFDGKGNLKTDLPDISKLDEGQQRKFYRIMRTALRGMNANPDKFADPDAPNPLTQFFGDKNIMPFSDIVVSPDTKDALKELAKHIRKDTDLKEKIKGQGYYKRFSDDYTIDQVLDDLIEGNYDVNTKTRESAKTIINTLAEFVEVAEDNSRKPTKMVQGALNVVYGDKKDKKIGDNLTRLLRELDVTNESIDDRQFNQFRTDADKGYIGILKALYDPKAADRQSAFFKNVAANNGSEITNPMATVIEKVNYDKVTPKYKDERSFWEQKNKQWDDWKDDHIRKFWVRALRHNYLEPNAKGVVSAIYKCKLSPTDGLGKILDEKEKIKKVIDAKYASSAKGFDFLCETLEDIRKSGDMDKALAGALKNGKKAAAIANEIIKRAAAQNRWGDAKVALETLAVMRYDIFSSARGKDVTKAIMGANFFEGTSFMKDPALKFIINAAQKGFNLGMAGVFWTGVVARNLVQHYRGKIPDAQIEKLQKSMAKIEENSKKFSTAEEAYEAWEKADKKMNEELTAVKEWESEDPTTGKKTKNSMMVKDLLEMRRRLYDMDDGTVEDKMEGLQNRLAADDKKRAQRKRAVVLARKLNAKKKQRQDEEDKVNLLKTEQGKREARIDGLRQRKAALEAELVDLQKLEAIDQQVAIAKADWDAAKAKSPEKKAAKAVYDDVLKQKKTIELNYQAAHGVKPTPKRQDAVIGELEGINRDIKTFDDAEQDIAGKQQELDNFGAGESEENRKNFIYADYAGDPNESEEVQAHYEKKMEDATPDELFKYFGFDGIEDEIERLKKVSKPLMSKKERDFHEADMEVADKLRDGHKSKLEQLNELLADYDGYVVSERVCHEEHKRLSELKAKGLEKDVPEKKYSGPSTENEQVQELVWFWNACNGFEPGVSVNDYNPFVKHKNKPQGQQFKALVEDKLAGRS